jgi:hypothetical protein
MKNIKKLTALFLIVFCMLACMACETNPDELQDDSFRVTVIIDCTDALSYRNSVNVIPESGMILTATEVLLNEGETIYDVLLRVQRLYNIAVATQTSTYGMYVTAIGGLEQGMCTDVSGWTYTVNDQMVMDACNDYVLQNGDTVKWEFITAWEF